MASAPRKKSMASSVLHSHFQRSLSPSGRFCSSSISSSSSVLAPSVTSFSSPSSGFFTPSSSSTRVDLCRSVSPSASSLRFSSGGPASARNSISVSPRRQNQGSKIFSGPKKACMCSPTRHPGSFRCSLHKTSNKHRPQSGSYHSHRLNARRSAMTNSLVRIGTVEGELVKRALAALVRPSSHHQRRRADFHPRPSRLSIMSKSEDL